MNNVINVNGVEYAPLKPAATGTRDEIIRMAREVGGTAVGHAIVLTYEEAKRFANLIAAAEREACAKVCDAWTHADGDACASAIRARGEK